MSKKLLREFYALCKDGVCQDLLTEREKAEMSNGAMYLSGRLQTADVSHIITKVWWEGKDVMGKIKVLDTPSGRILKDLVNAGVKLGISSRGLGSVKESAGQTVVESDFQLICFDMVSEPSTPNAYVYPKDQGNISTRLREVKENSINDLFKKILGD